jgi:hypothetical protein
MIIAHKKTSVYSLFSFLSNKILVAGIFGTRARTVLFKTIAMNEKVQSNFLYSVFRQPSFETIASYHYTLLVVD